VQQGEAVLQAHTTKRRAHVRRPTDRTEEPEFGSISVYSTHREPFLVGTGLEEQLGDRNAAYATGQRRRCEPRCRMLNFKRNAKSELGNLNQKNGWRSVPQCAAVCSGFRPS
jgi:hypothetical protein